MNPTAKKNIKQGLKKIPNFNGKTILVISVIGIALLTMTATAEAGSSSSWTKFLGQIWINDRISDSEFLNGIQFLVDENVIRVEPRIIEVQAQSMPTDNGKLWESIGALQEEDDQLRWEIYNNMIGAEAYNDYMNAVGKHEVELIELRADVHDLKLQLGCLIDAVKEDKQADCSQAGMTAWR